MSLRWFSHPIRKNTKPRSRQLRIDNLEDRANPANGILQFYGATSSASEGGPTVITVQLLTNDFDLNGSVSATFGVTGGTAQPADYVGGSTNFTFQSTDPYTVSNGTRQYLKQISVSNGNTTFDVVNDRRIEANETIILGMSSLMAGSDPISFGGFTAQTLTITDNDSAKVTFSGSAAVTEGGAADPNTIDATLSFETDGTGAESLDFDVTATMSSASSDFSVNSVSWLAGDAASTKSLDVTATNDRLVETPVESLSGTLSATGLGATSTAGSATVDVTDDDSAEVTVTGSTSFTEGNTSDVTVTLQLTTTGTGPEELAIPVTATFAAHSDFSASTATFAIGSADAATQTITLTATNDRLVEASTESTNHGLVVSPSAANVTTSGTHQVDVLDNDYATLATSGTAITVIEGSTATVPVTLTITSVGTGPEELAVTMSATLPGNADYSIQSDAVFAPGALTGDIAQVTIEGTDDRLVEAMTETFIEQSLSIVSDGGSTASFASGGRTVRVSDNDYATISISGGTSTTTEGGPGAFVLATLNLTTTGTGPSELAVNVDTKLADNADFSSTTIQFASGSVDGDNQNYTLAAVDDLLVERSLETFVGQSPVIVAANDADIRTSGSRDVEVNENDSATISISNGTTALTEGGSTATITAQLNISATGSGGAPALAIDVEAAFPNHADYSGSSITFAAGSLDAETRDITVSATNDILVEGSESHSGQSLSITTVDPSPLSALGSRTIDVTDNDTAALSFRAASGSVSEGTDTSVEVTLTITANGVEGTGELAVPITVDFAGPGVHTSDITLPSTPAITFAPGSISSSLGATVDTVNDRYIEASETFELTMTNATGPVQMGTDSYVLTVLDNDSAVISIPTSSMSLTEGGVGQDITATLTLTTDGTGPIELAVPITAALDTNADISANSVTFNVGALDGDTATITVSPVNDRLVEASENYPVQNLSITVSNDATVSASGSYEVEVVDNESVELQANSANATVTEGGTTNVPVKLVITSDGTGAEELAVPITATISTNSDLDVSSVATFAVGAVHNDVQQIVVGGVNDRLLEGNESYTRAIEVGSGGGATVSASGSTDIAVTDDESATVTVVAGTTTVGEGSTGDIEATLNISGSGTGPIEVAPGVVVSASFNATGDYAVTGVNFVGGTATGATANIQIAATDDRLVEPATQTYMSQALQVSANNGASASSTSTRHIAITDNETMTVSVVGGTTSVTEGDTANVSVSLSITSIGTGSEELEDAYSVTFTANDDFSVQALAEFAAGSIDGATANIVIAATDDRLVEAMSELFDDLPLQTPVVNGPTASLDGTRSIEINDNDSASIAIDSGIRMIGEGGSSFGITATLHLTTTGTGPSMLAVPVSANLPGSSEYLSDAASFAPGALDGSTSSVVITAENDQLVESHLEMFPGEALAISASGNADVSASGSADVVVVENDRVQLTFTGSIDLNEGLGGTNQIAVEMSLMTDGNGPKTLETAVSASILSATGDYYSLTQADWLPGDDPGVKFFDVAATNDRLVEATRESGTAMLQAATTADYSTYGEVPAVIYDNDRAYVMVNGSVPAAEGGGPVNVSATLILAPDVTGMPGSGPVELAVPVEGYVESTADVMTVSPAVFPVGSVPGTMRMMEIVAIDDNLVEDATEFAFVPNVLTNSSGDTQGVGSLFVNVTENDSALVTLSDAANYEGSGLSFTVTLDKPLDIDLTIEIDSFVGTATGSGVDFDSATHTVTFLAGTSGAQTVTFSSSFDSEVESNETFVLSMTTSSSIGLRSINMTDEGTGTILDNRAPVAVNDSATVDEDSSSNSFDVLANDSDPDSNNFAIMGVTQGELGVVTVGQNGLSVVYTPYANVAGQDTFTYTIDDGHGRTSTATVTVTINPVNDAPVVTVPGTQTFRANHTHTITGVSIADLDASSELVEVSVQTGTGVLSLATVSGLTFTTGDGTNDASMTFRGTLENVNTALASISYRPALDELVPGSIQVMASDLGNIGSGGTLTDSKVISLQPSTNIVAFSVNPNNSTINDLVIYGTNANDRILVSTHSGNVYRVSINGVVIGDYGNPNGRLVVFGLDGDDTISMLSYVSRPTWLDGGDGNDSILGGRGRDTLRGGAGNDTLHGGVGYDELYEMADVNMTLVGGNANVNGSMTGVGSDVLYRASIESARLVGGISANTIDTTAFGARVTLDGGLGNDVLRAGANNDVLLGGGGNDIMSGGAGRDMLIGGDGLDTMSGGVGDDIMIGARTTFDADMASLTSLMTTWTNTAVAYATRIGRSLTTSIVSTPLAPKFGPTTIVADGVADLLVGEGGRDWFFATLGDSITDPNLGGAETVTQL